MLDSLKYKELAPESLFIVILVFLGFTIANSQEPPFNTSIFVADANGNSLPGASVIVISIYDDETIFGGITNHEGVVEFSLEKNAKYNISFLGYEKLSGTIFPADKLRVKLKESHIEVSEILVSSVYQPALTENNIQKVTVIEKEEIETRGVSSLNELLLLNSNISIKQNDIYGSNMEINGIGGANVKILLNGVPVSGRLNNEIDLSQILLNDVIRIEIIEGPQSSIYGSNAMGGVINIVTQSRTSLPNKVSINGHYESNGRYNIDGNYNANYKGNSILLNGGRYFFDGFSTTDKRDVEWNPKEQYFANASYSTIWRKVEFLLSARYYREKVLNRYNPANEFSVIAMDDHFVSQRQQYLFALNSPFKVNQSFNFQTSYSKYKRKKNTYIKDLITLEETLSPSSTDHDTNTIYNLFINGQYSYSSANQNFKVLSGIQSDYETLRGDRIEAKEKSILDFATYHSAKFKYRRFTVEPSLRFIYNSIYKAPVVPAFHLRYDIRNFIMRASYARGFRAPSLKELYLDFVDINHNIIGNENLKSESGNYYNLNFEYKSLIKAHSLNFITGFSYTDVKDKIDLVLSDPNSLQYSYENFDRLKNINAKVSGNYKWQSLSWSNVLSLNFQNNSHSEDDNYFDQWQFASRVSYKLRKYDTHFNLDYKFIGEADRYFVNGDSGDLETYKAESYNLLDFSVSQNFMKEHISLTIGARNLFNVKNIESSSSVNGVHSQNDNFTPVGFGTTFFTKVRVNIF